MPNQNDTTQIPNPVSPSVGQPAGSGAAPPVPPVIFPQSDLPPLSPEFQNLPETKPIDSSGSGGTGSNAPPGSSSITPKIKKKFGGGKIIATILGLVLLIGGVGAGILLTQQPQLFKQKAATTSCSGCGDAPVPLPSFNQTPTQVGPFTAAGNLIIYYVGLGSNGNRTVYITSHDGSHTVSMSTTDKTRTVTNVNVNAGETITITNIQEPDQDAQCAPRPGHPNYALGWMSVNPDTTCGTGLNGPPTGGQCTPMDKPSVASAISWAQSFGDASLVGRQCWADWMEWPGDYDFNDFFLMFGVSATSPTPSPTPTPTPTPTPRLTPTPTPRLTPTPTPRLTPTPTPRPPAPYCVAVTTYRTGATSVTTSVTRTTETTSTSGTTWTIIPESERPSLKPGETIYFCVSGYNANGTFDKARFTINGVRQAETTLKRPGSTDICQSYKIPSSTRSFTVLGEIHDTIYGWFGGIATQ